MDWQTILSESVISLTVFVLLCASAGLGMFIRPRLPVIHSEHDTIELMQLTIGLLATFAALVLGLITASVKQSFDTAARDRTAFGLQLTQLDRCLRDYGPEMETARTQIRSYTAAVIASTWPREPPPTGLHYPSTAGMQRTGGSTVLAEIMNRIGVEISQRTQTDPPHVKLAALCMEYYRDLVHARLNVVEDAEPQQFGPFFRILVAWLMVMFGCFGLIMPYHGLSITTMFLCAFSLSSVIFVIYDLSQPYAGVFCIPSSTMRIPLAEMLTAG